jgi:hypothetical protein
VLGASVPNGPAAEARSKKWSFPFHTISKDSLQASKLNYTEVALQLQLAMFLVDSSLYIDPKLQGNTMAKQT